MRTLAIIPARGGSKRLPGKNVRPLLGKPLIQWTIEFARSVSWFDTVEVSTDSQEIAVHCAPVGIDVERLRPASLATDEATSVDVVIDVLDWLLGKGEHYDLVALLQPTTPLRLRGHWDDALAKFQADAEIEAVVGVGPAQSHPYLTYRMGDGGGLTPWVEGRPASLRAQDLPPAFVINGSLYLVRVDVLRAQRTFLPDRTVGVAMANPAHNLDIDTEFDWHVTESVLSALAGTK